jgi:hypothetical protein
MPLSVSSFLRSLSFGGLMGICLIGLFYVYNPNFCERYFSFNSALIFGGVLGSASHRLVDALVIQGILGPVGKFLTYYKKLCELEIQRRNNLLEDSSYKRLKAGIDEAYFLGSSQPLLKGKNTFE